MMMNVQVQKPLMPKSVEHQKKRIMNGEERAGAETFDAERR